MNSQLSALTLNDFIQYGLIGILLSVLYLFLIWQTITLLSKSRKKGFVLFLSSVLRIFLLIFIALACSKQNPAYFLIIMCAFFLTRSILLKLFKPGFKKKLTNSEVITQERKKEKYSNQVSPRRRTIKQPSIKKKKKRYY